PLQSTIASISPRPPEQELAMLCGILTMICTVAVHAGQPAALAETPYGSEGHPQAAIASALALSTLPLVDRGERLHLIVFRETDAAVAEDTANDQDAAAGKLVIEAGDGQYEITIDT